MQKALNWIIKASVYSLVFLLPVFFLPFSFESFEFNKLYLLYFLTSFAFASWLARQILFEKEIKFRRTILDVPVLIFLSAVILSAVFSVDKLSSVFGFYGRFSNGLIAQIGLVMFYFLIVGFFCLRLLRLRKEKKYRLKKA